MSNASGITLLNLSEEVMESVDSYYFCMNVCYVFFIIFMVGGALSVLVFGDN